MNPIKPHVIVTLDRPRKMAFDMNAIAEVEAVLDMPVISDAGGVNIFTKMKEGRGGIRYIRALLWAGLLFDDPKITIDHVGKLMRLDNLAEPMDAISKALTLFFQSQGIPLETEESPLPTTGSTSGASPQAPTASDSLKSSSGEAPSDK